MSPDDRRQAATTAAEESVEHNFVLVEEFDALSILVQTDAKAAAPTIAAPPKQKYPAKHHAHKVAEELGLRDGLIYLPGLPEQLYEDSDMGPAFRQRRYFYYLGGVDFAGCAVTYDLAQDYLVLWVPYIDPRQVLWFGTSPGPEECKEAVDIDDVRYISDLDGYLRKRLGVGSSGIVSASIGSNFCYDKKAGKAVLPPPTTLYVLHPDQVPTWLQSKGQASRPTVHINAKKLQVAMDDARVTKSGYEIAMIRRANDISSSAHRAVLRQLKGMRNEREIEAAFLEHCHAVFGAKNQAYQVIAGSGPNAGTLHYGANNEPLAGRQLVCLDAGAECDLYASDVTRTFPISGVFTPEAEAIYEAVYRMQTEVIERFEPGVAFATLHLHAALVAAQELLRIGILRGGTAREILAAGTVSAFFPHGLGHHVGLEVHDVLSRELMIRDPPKEKPGKQRLQQTHGSSVSSAARSAASKLIGGKRQLILPEQYATLMRQAAKAVDWPSRTAPASSDRQPRRLLEPGMIITVEPGIYFCRAYIEAFFLTNPKHAQFINEEALEQYYSVGGVRIEDCILVTEDGHENLTTAPKGKEALRIINGE